MTDYADVPAVPKIKLTRNSKQEAQWEISVVPGADDTTMDELRAVAMRQDEELRNALWA